MAIFSTVKPSPSSEAAASEDAVATPSKSNSNSNGNNIPSSPEISQAAKRLRLSSIQRSRSNSNASSEATTATRGTRRRVHFQLDDRSSPPTPSSTRELIQSLKSTLWWSKSDRSQMLQHARSMASTYSNHSSRSRAAIFNPNKQLVRKQLERALQECQQQQHRSVVVLGLRNLPNDDEEADHDNIFYSPFQDDASSSSSNSSSSDDEDSSDDEEDQSSTISRLAMPGLARGLEPMICHGIPQMRRRHVQTVLRVQDDNDNSSKLPLLMSVSSQRSSQAGVRLARLLALGDESLVYPTRTSTSFTSSTTTNNYNSSSSSNGPTTSSARRRMLLDDHDTWVLSSTATSSSVHSRNARVVSPIGSIQFASTSSSIGSSMYTRKRPRMYDNPAASCSLLQSPHAIRRVSETGGSSGGIRRKLWMSSS